MWDGELQWRRLEGAEAEQAQRNWIKASQVFSRPENREPIPLAWRESEIPD